MDKCPFCNFDAVIEEDSIKCSNPDCWKTVIRMLADRKPKSGSGNTPDDPIILYCPDCGKVDADMNVSSLFCDRCEKRFDNPNDPKYAPNKWYRFELTIDKHTYIAVKGMINGKAHNVWR